MRARKIRSASKKAAILLTWCFIQLKWWEGFVGNLRSLASAIPLVTRILEKAQFGNCGVAITS